MKNAKLIAETILRIKDVEVPSRDAEDLALAYLELLREKKALEKVLDYTSLLLLRRQYERFSKI